MKFLAYRFTRNEVASHWCATYAYIVNLLLHVYNNNFYS